MTYYLCPCCVNKNSLYYLKRNVKFEAAPEPEDIIFENLEVKPFFKNYEDSFSIYYFYYYMRC